MTGRLFALLAGIDAYPAPLPPLAGCVNDIVAAHGGLLARVGNDRLDARLLLDEKATRVAIIGGFRTHLAQAGPDDVALFYFSGHGSQQPSAPAIATEPDRRNETIVLVDSREPSGWDLADKELAALIAPVAARAGHVLVILDCCHSGDGTRGIETGTRLRVAPEDGRVRPPDTFLEEMPEPGPHSQVVRGAAQDASPETRPGAAGRHVLIAACRSSETAKETTAHGASRGVLSASIEGVLRETHDTPSYREVLRLVTARTLLRVPDQHPQVESVSALDLDRPFLGGAIPAEAPQLTISQLPDGWSLDAGAIQGISAPIGEDRTELAVYPLTGETSGSPLAVATVTKVLPDRSLVDLSTALDEGFVYRAVVTGIPLSPLTVAIVGSDADTAALHEAAADADDALIALADSGNDPALVVEATPDGFVITRPGVTRPLVPILSGPGHAARTVAALEHVARWMRLSTLANPTTSIPAGAISISTTSDAGALGPDGALHISYAAELAPTFEVTLGNTTDATLWCALLDLTETYGVFTDAFPAGKVELGPGQQTTVSLSGQVSDEQWRAGMIELTDRLRIVVSTLEFDPRSLEQAELDASTTAQPDASQGRGPRSSLAAVLTRTVPAVSRDAGQAPMADWRVEDLLVVTTRPRH